MSFIHKRVILVEYLEFVHYNYDNYMMKNDAMAIENNQTISYDLVWNKIEIFVTVM